MRSEIDRSPSVPGDDSTLSNEERDLSIRDSILDELAMLAEPNAQLEYENSLTGAGYAPTELVSVYCDDLYNPKSDSFISAFTLDEHRDLAHLYGLLVEVSYSRYPSVSSMLKDPKWRRVVEVAQQLNARLRVGR